jgi:CheY-like chemotaxis protein
MRTPASDTEPTLPSRQRVLVVEDSDDIREALKELLEDMGHEVDLAATGLEGVQRALQGRPDVALVDVGLPGIDGYEVARRLRASAAGASLYLVALTGYGGAEARASAQRAGFDVHLVKPLHADDLPRVLAASARAGARPR